MRAAGYPLRMTETLWFAVRLSSLVVAGCTLLIMGTLKLGDATSDANPLGSEPAVVAASDALEHSNAALVRLSSARSRAQDGLPLVPFVPSQPASALASPPRPTEAPSTDPLASRVTGVLVVGGVKRIVIDGDSFGVGDILDGEGVIAAISDDVLVVQRPGAVRRRIQIATD